MKVFVGRGEWEMTEVVKFLRLGTAFHAIKLSLQDRFGELHTSTAQGFYRAAHPLDAIRSLPVIPFLRSKSFKGETKNW